MPKKDLAYWYGAQFIGAIAAYAFFTRGSDATLAYDLGCAFGLALAIAAGVHCFRRFIWVDKDFYRILHEETDSTWLFWSICQPLFLAFTMLLSFLVRYTEEAAPYLAVAWGITITAWLIFALLQRVSIKKNIESLAFSEYMYHQKLLRQPALI